jgi:hypothetical protein
LREAVGEIGMTTKMPEHIFLNRLLSPSEVAEAVRIVRADLGLATGSTLDFAAGDTLR